jgi:pilus assembly protein Flp/PilA
MLNLSTYLANVIALSLHRGDRGATAVEYGLLVGLIAAVIIVVVTTLGTDIATEFSKITSGL